MQDNDIPKILVVDDEPSILESVQLILQKEGYEVFISSNGHEAMNILRNEHIRVVLTDLMMPKMSGDELLKACRTLSPDTEVIIMTAYTTVENAVHSMREGAYDFITKPLKRLQITKTIQKALEKYALCNENRKLKEKIAQVEWREDLIGQSRSFLRTMDVVKQVAPSSANVLIFGESGTGKELVAHSIYQLSLRANQPFVVVNCAALPESIIEAELFGHEKGAFTGAIEKKIGRIERADHGTLFLDEIGELSLSMQAKLLRVLQQGELERVGGDKVIQVDFRLIAATNRNLEEDVKKGNFRPDLFYRLNVISITVDPLRQRRDDIPLLLNYFLRRFNEKNNKTIIGITQRSREALENYSWPGNVRELQNVVERAVVLTRNTELDLEDFPESIVESRSYEMSAMLPEIIRNARVVSIPIGSTLEAVERYLITETLKETKGDKNIAAQILGINQRTIYRKISEYEQDENI